MPLNGHRTTILWLWLAIISLLVSFVGIRQVLVMERQATVIKVNAVQDDTAKELQEALKTHEQKIHPVTEERILVLERRIAVLEASVAAHHAVDEARQKSIEKRLNGVSK